MNCNNINCRGDDLMRLEMINNLREALLEAEVSIAETVRTADVIDARNQELLARVAKLESALRDISHRHDMGSGLAKRAREALETK